MLPFCLLVNHRGVAFFGGILYLTCQTMKSHQDKVRHLLKNTPMFSRHKTNDLLIFINSSY